MRSLGWIGKNYSRRKSRWSIASPNELRCGPKNTLNEVNYLRQSPPHLTSPGGPI